MGDIKKSLLSAINRFGQLLPSKIRRFITDFPGVLKLLEKLSRSETKEIATPEGFRLFINPLFHSNLVRFGDLGDYEPEIRRAIKQYTKPGMVAYDLGANVGIFSFLFASIVGNEGFVYAFEPEKNNYVCFDKSLENNKIQNIVLDKRAVGKSKGRENFDRRGGAFSGRIIGDDAQYSTTDNIEVVETTSIDQLISDENFRAPDILKIDVEGNEGMVIEGMKKTLATSNLIIICELHTHLGEASERVIDLLSSNGYTISGIESALTENELRLKSSDLSHELHIIAVKQSTAQQRAAPQPGN